jgi:hypothetical protein
MNAPDTNCELKETFVTIGARAAYGFPLNLGF